MFAKQADTNPAPIPLYLMAKAPIAGAVKTRMQPELDNAQSVKLASLMLQQSVEVACRHWSGEVVMCAWPQTDHPLFLQLINKYPITIEMQQGAELGARMLHPLKQGIARAGCAAVLGCDVPHCPGEVLDTAHARLKRGENVVGPAEDGGFYFLGLQRECADDDLFDGINWGSGSELDVLREHTSAKAIQFSDLPRLRDIDYYSDLEWLATRDASYQQFLRVK